MSVEAIGWAFRTKAPSSGAKFVLVRLANSAGSHGVVWLGQRRIATECQMSLRTVSEHMRRLEAAQIIARVNRHRTQNGWRTSDWTILAPRHIDRGDMVDADRSDLPGDPPIELLYLARRLDADSAPREVASNDDPALCADHDVPYVQITGGQETLEEPEGSTETANAGSLSDLSVSTGRSSAGSARARRAA